MNPPLISVILKSGVEAALDLLLSLPQTLIFTLIAVVIVAVVFSIFRGKEGRGI